MGDLPSTVFVTKYALTSGIREHAVIRKHGKSLIVSDSRSMSSMIVVGSQDAHLTRDAALKRAEQMRLARIAVFEKSLAKLKKMRFWPDAPAEEA